MSLFDECFHSFADPGDKPVDLERFFKKKVETLKNIPIDYEERRLSKFRKTFGAVHKEVTFRSFEKVKLYGDLFLPAVNNKKTPVVIYFTDYNTYATPISNILENDIALFILRLRGHLSPEEQQSKAQEKGEKKGLENQTPGFFSENMLEKGAYYMLALYLDAFRTLEMIRLQSKIDTSKIAIWGRGIGAAMALFAEYSMKRASALALDDPSFVNLKQTQNLSKADYAEEINAYLKKNRSHHQDVKKNLQYFDSIYLTDSIKKPIIMSINLAEKNNIPHGGFSLFHLLSAEKSMFLFPEQSTDDKAIQQKKKAEAITRFFLDAF